MIGAHVDSSEFMKTHDENSENFAADYEAFVSHDGLRPLPEPDAR
jgi:hypothetical protein